jgi:hypothetical protein
MAWPLLALSEPQRIPREHEEDSESDNQVGPAGSPRGSLATPTALIVAVEALPRATCCRRVKASQPYEGVTSARSAYRLAWLQGEALHAALPIPGPGSREDRPSHS